MKWSVLALIMIVSFFVAINLYAAESKKDEKVNRIGWAGKEKDISSLVNKADELGFNIIICHGNDDYEYLNKLCAEAKQKGISIYYWFHIITPKNMEQYSQVVNEKEREISKKIQDDKTPGKHNYQYGGEPVNPEEVHTGEFLCFHRPEVMEYSKDKIKNVLEKCPELQGIAFDFVGYKNYKCCKCPVSMKQFEEYIKADNTVSQENALNKFSLDTLVDYNNQLSDYVRKIKPGTKTATHIYPTFISDPVYGNRLDVDYCCQTAAWYFEPFWDLKKVSDYTEKITNDSNRYFPRPQGIPFVGIYMDNPGMNKSAERFREELKTIRKTGCRSFSICPFNIFLKHPELGSIVIEELGK